MQPQQLVVRHKRCLHITTMLSSRQAWDQSPRRLWLRTSYLHAVTGTDFEDSEPGH